ncbi:MAG: S-layer homology domain-containing protein [Clostridiales bacterium]|nr:S-layer homology domain-containing protein [Clostridiales bacterium]
MTNTIVYTEGTNFKADNYTITKTEGTLKITKNQTAVTITSADDNKMYDGKQLTAPTYTVKYGDTTVSANADGTFTLPTGDKLTITDTSNVVHVADTKANNNTFTYVLENADQYETVTPTYGTLTITTRSVTLTSATDSKEYDGKALTNDTVTVAGDGFAEGEGATYDVTGSQTEKGESANTFTYELNKGTTATDYNISTSEGKLIVSKSGKVVIISSADDSKKYDGKQLTAPTYTVTYGGATVTADESGKVFTLSTGDKLTITDTSSVVHVADTKANNNTFTYVLENADQYETVTTTYGTLTITTRSVTLTSATDSKEYDGKALTNDEVKETGDGFVEGEGATYDVTGSQTMVGSSENTFDYTLKDGTEKGNYNITKVEGTLTVTGNKIDPPTKTTPEVETDYKLGEEIPFEITVHNITSETLENIEVTDENAVIVSGDGYTVKDEHTAIIEKLTSDATVTIKAKHTVTEEDIIEGEVENTATVKTPDGEFIATGSTTQIEDPDTKLTVNKTVTNDPEDGKAFKLGETIKYNIAVKNEGNVTYKKVVVKDDLTGFETEIKELGVGETKNFSVEHTVSEDDIVAGFVKNTATAKGEPINGKTPEGEDTVTTGDEEVPPIEELDTTLTVNKTVTNTPKDGKAFKLGETIEYNIAVKNEGNVTYKKVVVKDDLTGFETEIEELGVGETKNFQIKYTVTEADIVEGFVKNTATAKGDPINGKTPEGEDTVTTGDEKDPDGPVPPIEELDTTLTVNKTVTNTPKDGKAFKLGETIEYNIAVTNDGNATYKKVVVKDDLTGFETEIEELAVGETKNFPIEYTVKEADIVEGFVKNTATAKGDPINGKTPEGEDTVTTGDEKDPDGPVPPIEEADPSLKVVKKVTSTPANGETYVEGEEVTYTITVTNDGNLTITDITVKDDLTGLEKAIEKLEPGKSETFNTTYTVTKEDVEAGSVKNVATADGKNKSDTPTDPGKDEVEVKTGEKEEELPPYVPSYMRVKVTKVWAKDENNAFKTRQPVTVYLLKNGKLFKEVVLDDSNNWTKIWCGLDPKFTYTVEEKKVEGYDKFITAPKFIDGNNPNGGIQFTIINTLDNLIDDHVAYSVGYPDGTVGPNRNITRAEVATIFFRLLTDEARDRYWSQTNPYTDVMPEAWYNNAISTLSNMGILNGYADGTFRPNNPITRAELTKIASSFFGTADLSDKVSSFTDVSSDAWYSSFIKAAEDLGLVNGYGDGTFLPDNYITRAETFAIVNRTLKRAPHKDHLLPGYMMNVFPDNMDTSAWYFADVQEATNSHDYKWVTEGTKTVEEWTAKLPERDWTALEHSWSDSHIN